MSSLIFSGVAVDSKNAAGDTALHLSIAERHKDATLLLLRAGASLDEPNNDEQTPRHLANDEMREFIIACTY